MRLNSHPERPSLSANSGPTNVPDRVLRAMDHPTIDHRGPEFNAPGQESPSLRPADFSDKTTGYYLSRIRYGAWEAALVNTLSPGDQVLMWETGHSASLWKKMADKLGIKPEFLGGD